MAIQIPTLKKIAPQPEPQTAPINVGTPDTTQFVARQSQAANHLMSTVQGLAQKFEDDAVELASTKAASDYEVRYKTELRKLKNWDGDPTPVYVDFDNQESAWEDEILGGYEGASDRVKTAIRTKIAKKRYELADIRGTNEATQYQAWDMKTTNSAVTLEKEGIMDASSLLNAEDPDSFLQMQVRIDNIKNLRIQSGSRRGLVRVDEKGNEQYSPSLKLEIKKDISDALKDTILTLHASGKTAEADMIAERYKDDLMSDAREKIATSGKESKVRMEAAAALDKVRMMDPDEAMDALDKRIKDPLVREKAIEMLDAYQRRMDNARERAAKAQFEKLAEHINDRKSSGQGYVTVQEMLDDEIVARVLGEGKLDHKQRKALEEMIEQPKNSDPEVKGKAYEALHAGKFAAMSWGDLSKTLSGLNESDRSKFEKQWSDIRNQTTPEKSRMVQYMGNQLTAQMQAAGVVSKDYANRFSNKQQIKITQWQDELLDVIERFPPNAMSLDAQNKYVKEFVAKKIKEQVFTGTGNQQPKFQSAPTAPAAPAPTPGPKKANLSAEAELMALSAEERSELLRAFRLENGRPFKQGDKVEALLKHRKGKQ